MEKTGETIFYSDGGALAGIRFHFQRVWRNFISIFILMVLLISSGCGGGGSGGGLISLPQLGETPTNDLDGDGWEDDVDMDDDGDLLIEVSTAAQLNDIRNYLSYGEGSNASIRDCGSREKIVSCRGYEIIANISLEEYENWTPIGYWAGDFESFPYFDMIFEGNGYTISDLRINLTAESYRNILPAEVNPVSAGVGLFATAGPNSTFANLDIVNFQVHGNDLDRVATLVGIIDNPSIPDGYQVENISISNSSVHGRGDVGGLAGYYHDGRLRSLRSENTKITGGRNEIGGLVGTSRDLFMENVALENANISGRQNVGGILGYSSGVDISAAVVSNTSIALKNDFGGMISGYNVGSSLNNSKTFSSHIAGRSRMGGLYGYAGGTEIRNTSSYNNSIHAQGQGAGGLIGYATSSGGIISDSYASGNILHAEYNVGGLAGYASSLEIRRSYVSGGFFNTSYQLGGLIGYSRRNSIKDVYVLGTWLHIHDRSRREATVGGVFGVIADPQDQPTSVNSSYVSLSGLSYSLTNNTDVLYGGVIGGDPGDAVMADIYWERDIPINGSGGNLIRTNSLVGSELSELELRQADNGDSRFQNFDALCEDGSKAWDFGTPDDYPTLTCPPDHR